jgi:hypothetical protein
MIRHPRLRAEMPEKKQPVRLKSPASGFNPIKYTLNIGRQTVNPTSNNCPYSGAKVKPYFSPNATSCAKLQNVYNMLQNGAYESKASLSGSGPKTNDAPVWKEPTPAACLFHRLALSGRYFVLLSPVNIIGELQCPLKNLLKSA